MEREIKIDRPLSILLAAAVLVSVVVAAVRWRAEADNTVYDVVMDYGELELMAEQSGRDVSWWLEQFRDMDVTRIALTEESLSSLMEDPRAQVSASMVETVLEDPDWEAEYPAEFVSAMAEHGYDRFDVLVRAEGEAAAFLARAVPQRLPDETAVFMEREGTLFLLLDGTVEDALYTSTVAYQNTEGKSFTSRSELAASKLMYVSLGLLPEKVERIDALGLEIVPRTICYNGHNGARYAQAVLDGYASFGLSPAYLIAGGEAVVGWDEPGGAIVDYVRDNGISVGLIETNVQRENIEQAGVQELAEATGYDVVRIFSMWDYVQYRYAYYGYAGAEEIENSLYRAVVERNVRVIYFKPIKQTDDRHVYITDPEIYRDLFDGLDQRLAAHHITRGRASVLPEIGVPALAQLALGLGAGIGGALLIGTFLPIERKWQRLLALAAAVCVAGAWRVMPNTYRLVASFASAVVFACLAAASFLRSAKRCAQRLPAGAPLGRILPRAALILACAVAISLAGALMTAAPLSSTPFMLEIGIFRGVKAAQLLPLGFFCVLFLACYGLFQREREEDVLRLEDVAGALRWTIPVWALIVLALVGAAGYYYLARTGHETDVSISTLELILRNDLENLLLARPRTKEFLVAFPAVMLTVYCAVRRMPFWTALFGLAGTIGMTSVCNTFMHIRTPLYLGFLRTAYALLLGVVLGVVYIVCFELLCRLCGRVRAKLTETERR